MLAVTQECLGSEIKMAFVVPDTFRGEVYLSEDEDNCKFNQMEAGVPGLNKYSLTIPFNSTDNVCSQSINKTKDQPMVRTGLFLSPNNDIFNYLNRIIKVKR